MTQKNNFFCHSIMSKFKLRNSLAKDQYVKTLVQQCVCHVKEMIDYTEHKMNPELISAVMSFINLEIANSKYAKEDFDKTQIVKQVLLAIFELNESELASIEQSIQFIIDNKLVAKKKLISTVLSGAKQLVTFLRK